MKKSALIIVDVQNDFLPKGALGVPSGDVILPSIKRLLTLPFALKVASKDWHPEHHCSFATTWGKKHGDKVTIGDVEQKLWPDHCIQESFGAEFSKELDVAAFDLIVEKGVNPNVDSYSTFFDNNAFRSTGLDAFLRKNEIEELYFAGLTTEYCVYYSVLDAVKLGFRPHMVIDACCGVELEAGDVAKAIEDMKKKGVELVTTEQVIKRFSR